MIRTIRAIFENGVLRPLEPLGLPEHSPVDITVSTPDTAASGTSPGIGACVGALGPEDAAEMRGIIEREFEQVDPRDW